MRGWNGRGGFALGTVIAMSGVLSLAAVGILSLSMTGHRQVSRLHEGRTRARLAAESGLVWAMQRLMRDETWSSAAGRTSPGCSIGSANVAAERHDVHLRAAR